MGVDNLGFRLLLNLFAVLVFCHHVNRDTQNDAFASPAVFGRWHKLRNPYLGILPPLELA